VDYAIIALLLGLMVRVFLRRNDTEPPKVREVDLVGLGNAPRLRSAPR
jgi:hypothetical protein